MAKRNKRSQRADKIKTYNPLGKSIQRNQGRSDEKLTNPSPLALRSISPFSTTKYKSPSPAPQIKPAHKPDTARLMAAVWSAPTENKKRSWREPTLSTKSEHAMHSDNRPRDHMTCKKRPDNNRKNGGSSSKRFIPWCG